MNVAFWQALAEATARALALSIVESALLAGCAAFALRAWPGARAGIRHTVWAGVLVVAALLPAIGICSSLARIEHVRADAAGDAATVATGLATIGHAPAARARLRDVSAAARERAGSRAGHRALLSVTVPASEAMPAASRNASALASVWRVATLLLLAVWAAGAAFGVLGLMSGVLALARIKRAARPLDGHAAAAATGDARSRRFAVAATAAVDVPVAVGFRTPSILIPERVLASSSEADLARIVLHETAHIRRYDDVANLVQRAIERVFWFNPAIAYAGARLSLERELAADEWVVERTGGAYDYATCLVRLLDLVRDRPRSVVAPGAILSRRDLAVRIERLLERDRTSVGRRRHGSAVAVAAIALATLVAQLRLAPAIAVADVTSPPAGATAATDAATAVTAPAAAVPPVPAAMPTPPPNEAEELARHLTAARALSQALVEASTEPHVIRVRSQAPPSEIVIYDDATPLAAIPRPRTPATSAADPIAQAGPRAMPDSLATIAPELDREIEKAMRELERLQPQLNAEAPTPRDFDAQIGALRRELRERQRSDAETLEMQHALDALRDAQRRLPANLDSRMLFPMHANLDRNFVAGQACTGCDFAGADLHGRDLRGVRLSAATLAGANLSGADLRGAVLDGVNLSGARLDGADLRGAMLDGINLEGASLRGARLSGARLRGGNLDATIFDGADVTNVAFEGCNFDRASFARVRANGLQIDGKPATIQDLSRRGAIG